MLGLSQWWSWATFLTGSESWDSCDVDANFVFVLVIGALAPYSSKKSLRVLIPNGVLLVTFKSAAEKLQNHSRRLLARVKSTLSRRSPPYWLNRPNCCFSLLFFCQP